ncbi:MAG: phosphonate metabolism protein PhnM [Rhizobiaceae bacterium MnEN-MB40S]|nr:MAG: phosphonate metabolism protein PhnM [Rhizobiaceae bacterium MnEN-MB40S]
MSELILKNARIVLDDEVVKGTLVIRDGKIADISTDTSVPSAEDLSNDYLIPGLVELHTDHLEGHYAPRPKVRWNPLAAVLAHDAQICSSGITTVLDALRVGMDHDADLTAEEMQILANAIDDSSEKGSLRADHFLHLRCEVSAPNCHEQFRGFDGHPRVRMASLMDHAPGQRQFRDLDQYAVYYRGKLKMTEQEFQDFCKLRIAQSEANSDRNRGVIAETCKERGIVLASHDDATLEHVEEAVQQGIHVAEFPTTMEAARASKEAGMAVLMGAPNVVRGGSHSGNIAARELAENNLLDILSSDYIPFSLIQSAFYLDNEVDAISLPQAIQMVSKNPAKACGLDDRGEIAIGKRGDLVRVGVDHAIPIVRTVWREGRRVV